MIDDGWEARMAERARTRRQAQRRTRIRVAGFLIACDGGATHSQLGGVFVREHGIADASIDRILHRDLAPLLEEGLVVRDRDGYTVPNLGDLADWLADTLNGRDGPAHGWSGVWSAPNYAAPTPPPEGHPVKIKVVIEVEIESATGRYPSRLGWQHSENASDNPAHYGDAVQRALAKAHEHAHKSAQPYVVYRDSTPPPEDTK
jgi:hypothetical protein